MYANNTKPWYQSLTIWVNVAAIALVAIEAQLAELQPLLPVNVYAAIAVALPIINALLRVRTHQGLTK